MLKSLPRHRTFPALIISFTQGNIMDNVDHCRRQAQECRRLLQQPQSAAQAQVLKNLCNSWVRLANQTDLYAEIVRRERSSEKIEAVPIRDFAYSPARGGAVWRETELVPAAEAHLIVMRSASGHP
jgi:hypothetical protein